MAMIVTMMYNKRIEILTWPWSQRLFLANRDGEVNNWLKIFISRRASTASLERWS